MTFAFALLLATLVVPLLVPKRHPYVQAAAWGIPLFVLFVIVTAQRLGGS